MTRRRFLGATALLGLAGATGCGADAGVPAAPAPVPVAPPSAPLTSADALLGWMRANPANWTLALDDGRGTVLEHAADEARPLASTGKVLALAAYARAVATGVLDPAQTMTVRDWERWYVAGTDGQGHPRALASLKATPDGRVTWDQLAAVMIAYSDGAAPDILRDRLGDGALVDTAAVTGWASPDLPSFGGEGLLSATDPLGWVGRDTAQRRAAAVAELRAYAADPARRAAHVAWLERANRDPAVLAPTLDPRFYAGTAAGTARQVAGIHRACATDGLGVPGAGPIARAHLERPLAGRLPRGVVGIGEKGGNYPGIATNAVTVRRADGALGVCVLLISGVPEANYLELLGSAPFLEVSRRSLLSRDMRERLRAVVPTA
ncbi:MAG: serine hydrolase [Pseudonocardia sediminis]